MLLLKRWHNSTGKVVFGLLIKHFCYFLLFSIFFSLSVTAQSNKKSTIILKATPTSAINLNIPCLEVGLEFIYKKIGIAWDQSARLQYATSDHKKIFDFQKFRTELRYYPGKSNNFFVATEYLQFSHNTLVRHNSYLSLSGKEYSFDEAVYYKRIQCISIKGGLSTQIKKFKLEYLGGLGIRRAYIDYKSVTNPVETIVLREWFVPVDIREGVTNNLLHISLQVKVGYPLF